MFLMALTHIQFFWAIKKAKRGAPARKKKGMKKARPARKKVPPRKKNIPTPPEPAPVTLLRPWRVCNSACR